MKSNVRRRNNKQKKEGGKGEPRFPLVDALGKWNSLNFFIQCRKITLRLDKETFVLVTSLVCVSFAIV